MSTADNSASDIRSIETEIDVPGTPEQVWEAIATGPGISAWFVPAELDEREGGVITTYHGPGMEAPGIVTSWDPPHRFVYEEELARPGVDAPATLATEFLVEARSGGTCVVRLVSNLFGGGHDWDRELEGMEKGWDGYLYNLRLYLTHFPGRRCSTIMVSGSAPGVQEQAWSALISALDLGELAEGEKVKTASDAPTLAGVVERVAQDGATLLVHDPASGFATIEAYTWNEQVTMAFHAHLFGDEAPAVAAREERAWQAWMNAHFPFVSAAAEAGATTT
jgi:uncharacterized protein YndB with AHSA1/START domain